MDIEHHIVGLDGKPIKPTNSFINYAVTLSIGLGSFLYGYTSNVVTGALAMESFNAKFLSKNFTPISGGMLGIFLGGGVIGAILQAELSKRFGRRVGLTVGSIFVIVGSALVAGSVKLAMFLVGRLLAGIGSGICLTIAPLYISELAPPHSRGWMVSFHVFMLNCGYLFSSCASLGLSYMTDAIQWRLNFIIDTACALLLLVALIAIPESPRWLVAQGRHDEAMKILERLHKNRQDPDGQLAKLEMHQIQEQIKADSLLPTGYLHIMRTAPLRKRAFCTVLVWVTCQSTGILVISFLTPTIFNGLGFGSTQQFGLSVAWLGGCIIGAGIGGYYVDRAGRVTFMVAGGTLCIISLILEAAIQANFLGTSNKHALSAGVAFYFLFGFSYNLFYDSGSFVYTAEIWPSHLRTEGVTIAMSTFYCFSIAYVTPATEAFASIGWKYYLVFIIVSSVLTATLWFYLPETKGLTLEEIGIRFGETPVFMLEDAANQKDVVAQTVEHVPGSEKTV